MFLFLVLFSILYLFSFLVSLFFIFHYFLINIATNEIVEEVAIQEVAANEEVTDEELAVNDEVSTTTTTQAQQFKLIEENVMNKTAKKS